MQNSINRYKLVTLVAASALLLGACTHQENPDETPTVSPEPKPIETVSPSPESTGDNLPDNWETSTDQTLGVSISHPVDWYVSRATNETGELAVTSFNPEATPDRGGVPQTELKVAVVKVSDDLRGGNPAIDPENVVSSENIEIAGAQATLYVLEGGLGGSQTTEVETESGTYLISAYPPDSELISTYRQMLQTIEFTE